MPFFKVFYRLILRPLRREPLRTSLTVMAVALGVAAVLAIELAGDAAAGSFQSSLETLTGNSGLEITTTGGLPSAILTRLTELPYPLKIHPRIEDYAVISDTKHTVPVIGVDFFSESFPQEKSRGSSESDSDVFRSNDSVWISKELSEDLGADYNAKHGDTKYQTGYQTGGHLTLFINDSSAEYKIRGVINNGSGEAIVMDLATAAKAFRRGDKLDRILIEVPPTRSIEEWESLISKALPEGVTLARLGTQTNENRRMLEAFRWNLRVLSYVSLTVGAFLIYNTISVSVVRRRFEIGILRALGASRSVIMGAFLGESAAFGLLGAFAGVALGRFMAEGAVKLVAATVESLYVTSQPAPISLTWESVLLALAIGVGISLLSGLSPAWEASLVAPVEAMARGRREHEVRTHRWIDLLLAAGMALAAGLSSRQPPIGGKPLFGYLAAILLIGTSALTIPALVSGLCLAPVGLIRKLFGAEGLLATRSLVGSLRRTSVLVGALSTAIAVLVAVGIMVGSFRQTVVLWLSDQLQADLYIGPAAPAGADRHPTMSPDIAQTLAELPEVAAIDQLRAYEIRYQGLPATLGGIDARVAGRFQNRKFLSGASPPSVFNQLLGTNTVIVSEPFANKHHVRSGDLLSLPLSGKAASFRVVDIYYDYSSERGLLLMDRATLFRYLPDSSPSNIAVYLKPGVSADEARKHVEAAVAGRRVLVFLNRSLRAQGMRIFDRTFAITYALEAIAVFVAVMGVGGALLALVLDRRREFGLLRFLGAADHQLRRMILFEAGLLGLIANVAGLILGFFLSLVLIYVINKQSFGWTIQFHWPVSVLLTGLSLVYAATLLAGLYPARIATQLIPIEVIHEE